MQPSQRAWVQATFCLKPKGQIKRQPFHVPNVIPIQVDPTVQV